jgi:hypothetical protein
MIMLDEDVVTNGPTKCSGLGLREDSAVIVSGSEVEVALPLPILIVVEPAL